MYKIFWRIMSASASWVNRLVPVYDDSKWKLIIPFEGSEIKGFCTSALIATIIYVSYSPNVTVALPNASSTVFSTTL